MTVVALSGAAAASTASLSLRGGSTRACKSAIFSQSLSARQHPRAVNAVVVGDAIFNDLRGARKALDRPRANVPFYTYKSPLTLWPGPAPIIITVVKPVGSARLIYTIGDLQRMGVKPIRLRDLASSQAFDLCRDAKTHAILATQYNGGFALAKPECVTVSVKSAGGEARRRVIPFGVNHC